MERLADITIGDLQRALEQVDEKKPALRLVAAIAYKHGVTQGELADWLGVERKTVYNWLTRLESGDLVATVHDEHRPGRPRKLSAGQFEELKRTLRKPPTDAGYEDPAWTTTLVREHVRDRYGVDYSRPSCRRLLKEAGLRYRTAREAAVETDPNERAALEAAIEELGGVWWPE